MKRTLFFLSFIIVATALRAGEIYVSPQGNDRAAGTKAAPFLTIDRAMREAREWRRLHRPEVAEGIYIRLMAGVYSLTEPLFVRPEDSGTATSPTVITAAGDAQPVVSGGVAVAGWKRGCANERIPQAIRDKVWVAEAPRVGNRRLEIRQLWVNGRKARRAMQHPEGVMERMIAFDPEEETITIPTPQISTLQENAARLEQLARNGQMEMLVHQRWAIALLRVKSMDVRGGQTVVRFHQPESRLEFAHPWPQPVIGGDRGNSAFCLMNAAEFLDEPGEWYQDGETIYYYPCDNERMETAAVIAPALKTLMTVDGTLERPVRHIRFEGITFAHTAWLRPSHQGHVTLQGGFPLLDAYKLSVPGLPEKAELENQAWIVRPEAAISIRGAEHIDFNHCSFRHLASTGLDYAWAASASTVERCLFSDIGGTALLVGTFPDGGFETHVPYIPADERELCSNIHILHNIITDATNEDWGCVGIGAGYVRDILIAHNEVCHVNYSGICVGWGWTSRTSGMRNNRIEDNHVHHFAAQLYDAGGLYTLSAQPGSVMRGNRLHHLLPAPYATNDRAFYIYLDEATDGYTIENNRCPEPLFNSNQPGKHNIWKNNGPE